MLKMLFITSLTCLYEPFRIRAQHYNMALIEFIKAG